MSSLSLKTSALSLGSALLAASLLASSGCKSDDGPASTPPPPADASMPNTGPDLKDFKSDCGHPGDPGNSLGVGKFCLELSDCADNVKATLCTTLGDDTNFFCTFACSRTGSPDQCGENAICQCGGGGCGCYPSACVDTPPDMGVADMTTPDLQPAPDLGP